MSRVEDGQVQRVHLRTAIHIGEGEGVGAALRVFDIVPDKTIALAHRHCRVRRTEDGQIQRIHLRAAVGILMRVGVTAALGEGRVVPGIALAGCNVDNLSHRMENRQVQGHDTVAHTRTLDSVGSSVGALCIGGAIPHITIAGRNGKHALCGCARRNLHRDGGRFAGTAVHRAHHRVGGGLHRGDRHRGTRSLVGPDV